MTAGITTGTAKSALFGLLATLLPALASAAEIKVTAMPTVHVQIPHAPQANGRPVTPQLKGVIIHQQGQGASGVNIGAGVSVHDAGLKGAAGMSSGVVAAPAQGGSPPGVTYGANTFGAVATGASVLNAQGHGGPYAATPQTTPFADLYGATGSTVVTGPTVGPLSGPITTATLPSSVPAGSPTGVLYGQNTLGAVATGAAVLAGQGHPGPYAATLQTNPYADLFAATGSTLVSGSTVGPLTGPITSSTLPGPPSGTSSSPPPPQAFHLQLVNQLRNYEILKDGAAEHH